MLDSDWVVSNGIKFLDINCVKPLVVTLYLSIRKIVVWLEWDRITNSDCYWILGVHQ